MARLAMLREFVTFEKDMPVVLNTLVSNLSRLPGKVFA